MGSGSFGDPFSDTVSGFNFGVDYSTSFSESPTSLTGASAPPGTYYLQGEIRVTNEQTDRPAPWTPNLSVEAPYDAQSVEGVCEQNGFGSDNSCFYQVGLYNLMAEDPEPVTSAQIDPGATVYYGAQFGPVDETAISSLTYDTCDNPTSPCPQALSVTAPQGTG